MVNLGLVGDDIHDKTQKYVLEYIICLSHILKCYIALEIDLYKTCYLFMATKKIVFLKIN